jgi:hypothetical protein
MIDVDVLIAILYLAIALLSAANAYYLLKAGSELLGEPVVQLGRRDVRALVRRVRALAYELRPREVGALVLAFGCLACVPLVFAPLPAGLRTVIVLPVALLAPGFCVTRRVGIREPLIEVALAFPISAALWVVAAQADLYLHAWFPRAGFAVLILGSAATLLPELRRLPAELLERAAA